MRYALFLAVACSALLFSASRCERPKAVTPGQPFTLAIGESAACKSCDAGLTFTALTEDSRCPRFTNCVWEGQAKIQVQLAGASTDAVELTLRADQAAQGRVTIGGYRLVWSQLDPYPESDRKITAADYRAVFIFEQLR